MRLAVNYSRALAELVAAGQVVVDLLKCPAWPALVAEARRSGPVYIHFPLVIGQGTGQVVNSETGQPADWAGIERLLAETATPFINLHFRPPPVAEPPGAVEEWLVANGLRDLAGVVARFGAERVIVENLPGRNLPRAVAGAVPEALSRLLRETGCGLLLDLSHARLAAMHLGEPVQDYLARLPVERLRELHLTGIQRLGTEAAAALRQAGVEEATVQRWTRQPMDHLPLTETDWAFVLWALARIRAGAWSRPSIVALEYGGVGALWETLTDRAVLATQVPRLRADLQRALGASG